MTPPINPITLAINGLLINARLAKIQKEHYPEYEFIPTSGYRSPVINARTPGAASDSAHVYNLAKDFVIAKDGKVLSDSAMQSLWTSRFNPNWPDYSYFSPKKSHTKTGWIHANLPRKISEGTFLFGLVGTIGIGWTVYRMIKKRRTAK